VNVVLVIKPILAKMYIFDIEHCKTCRSKTCKHRLPPCCIVKSKPIEPTGDDLRDLVSEYIFMVYRLDKSTILRIGTISSTTFKRNRDGWRN
jgi:hypothetical protein